MGDYKRYKPGNYAENIPNYGMIVKRPVITNSGDTKIAQAAPPGSAQAKAENIAVAQLTYPENKLKKMNSISNYTSATEIFDLAPRTPALLETNRNINIASARAYEPSLSSLKEASASSVKFKPTVDVLIFEVSHYDELVRTPEKKPADYTDYLKKAEAVSKCLYNIIKNLVKSDGEIDETIEAEIEDQIAKNPSLFLRTSMSTAMGKDECDALLSGRNLIILDKVIYKHQDATIGQPAITVTFLDHAIAGALQAYKDSPHLRKLIRFILSVIGPIIVPIKKMLGIGGRRTRRNKRSGKIKKSKRRSSKKTKRRNSSRRN